jgi:hypothetical protein
LLERAGLRGIALETPGVLDVDIVRNKILAGHQIKDTFVSFFVEKSDKRTRDRLQDFLQDNNLSSNMWAVCKNAE